MKRAVPILVAVAVLAVPATASADVFEACGPDASYAEHGVWRDGQGQEHIPIPDLPLYRIVVERAVNWHWHHHPRHRGRWHRHIKYDAGLRVAYPGIFVPHPLQPPLHRNPQMSISGATTYSGPAPFGRGNIRGIRVSRSSTLNISATWTEERADFPFDANRDPNSNPPGDRHAESSECTRNVSREFPPRSN
jgi:hypothetical protein